VERWYKTGSFPSGHTMKAVFFLLFILQYQVFSPVIYLLITISLLSFRVLAGFHYPIDMLGGLVLGLSIWLTTYRLQFPPFLVNFIRTIFNIF
jgi:membrane-associated phospholipid phosphatase